VHFAEQPLEARHYLEELAEGAEGEAVVLAFAGPTCTCRPQISLTRRRNGKVGSVVLKSSGGRPGFARARHASHRRGADELDVLHEVVFGQLGEFGG